MNEQWAAGVRAALAALRAETTACPGAVAKGLGTTLRALRPTLQALAARGEIAVTQGGRPVDIHTARGPLRIAPTRTRSPKRS